MKVRGANDLRVGDEILRKGRWLRIRIVQIGPCFLAENPGAFVDAGKVAIYLNDGKPLLLDATRTVTIKQ